MSRRVLAFCASFGVAASLLNAISPATANPVETDYIIQVPEDQQGELLTTLSDLGVDPEFVYDSALTGVAVSLTPGELSVVRSEVSGDVVETDQPVQLMTAQTPAPWNLAMIDSSTRPADQVYVYPDSAGAGVRVYVIDTGIAGNNPELTGRVLPGVSFVTGDNSTSDCHGHGTHVAGSIAATTYGVAKMASVVPIRVFNCTGGGATESKIISGINWAIQNKPAGTVGVINMSLGLACGDYCSSLAMVNAVQTAVDANFVVVVSAGNAGRDACTFAPAAAPSALTVGAIDRSSAEVSWSNYGPCVDFYAPGDEIVSLSYNNPSGTSTMSGTSMSAPHVAGAAALFIAANSGATAASVTNALKEGAMATPVIPISSHVGSPNAQLNVSSVLTNASIGIVPAAPATLSAVVAGLSDVDLSWAPAPSSVDVTDYVVSYRVAGSLTWTTTSAPPATTTTERVSGLLRDTSYEFRVQGKTDIIGPASTVSARTFSGIPARPTGLASPSAQATSVNLSWSASKANGASVTDYHVQYRVTGTSSWLNVADPVSASPSAVVSGLLPAKSYEFRARALTNVGTGAWSGSFRATTLSGIPGVVTNVSARSTTPTTLELTWVAPANNGASIRDYVIEFKRTSDTTWRTLSDGISASTSTTISGLTAGASYNVRVTATSDFGNGLPSVALSTVTLSGRPSKVASLVANPTSTAVTLSWPAATANGSPVTDYLIDYRLASVGTWTRHLDGVSATPGTTVPGLLPNQTYYVRVYAVSAYGNSAAFVSSVRTLP